MDEPQKLGSSLNNNSAPLLGADHDTNIGHSGAPSSFGSSFVSPVASIIPSKLPTPPVSPLTQPMPPKIFSSLPSFAPAGTSPRPVNVPPPLPPMPSSIGSFPARPFVVPPASSLKSAFPTESKTPAPSAPMVNIRSMTSDMQTLKESGGIAPKPQTIKLETLEDTPPAMGALITDNQLSSSVSSDRGGRTLKIFFEIIVIFLLAGILSFVGYYFVYPLIFDDQSGSVISEVDIKIAKNDLVAKPKAEASLIHKSFFINSIKEPANVILSDLTSLDIIEALQAEAKRVEVAGTLKEIILQKGGLQVEFSKYLSTLLTSISVSDIKAVVDEDFTGFMYYDDKGVWPGYVAHIKKGSTPAEIANFITNFEASAIAMLYVADPGSAITIEDFLNGPYKGEAVRYVKFTKPGASVNYGIFGELLVISTSFNGLKASVDALGL